MQVRKTQLMLARMESGIHWGGTLTREVGDGDADVCPKGCCERSKARLPSLALSPTLRREDSRGRPWS